LPKVKLKEEEEIKHESRNYLIMANRHALVRSRHDLRNHCVCLVIHLWWLPKHGINGWTGEPREKYYALRGWKKKTA